MAKKEKPAAESVASAPSTTTGAAKKPAGPRVRAATRLGRLPPKNKSRLPRKEKKKLQAQELKAGKLAAA